MIQKNTALSFFYLAQGTQWAHANDYLQGSPAELY
jgi:hypothetical protein